MVIKVGDNTTVARKHGLYSTREDILSKMRHNPNASKDELIVLIGISDTTIDNNTRYSRNNGFIKSIGINKIAIWRC